MRIRVFYDAVVARQRARVGYRDRVADFLLGTLARQSPIRPYPVSEEIDSPRFRKYRNFTRMDGETEFPVGKIPNVFEMFPQFAFRTAENGDIVHVPDVSAYPEEILGEVVETVQVDVGEQLARKASNGHPFVDGRAVWRIGRE